MKQRHFKSMVFEASGSEPTLEIKSPFDGAMVGTVSVADFVSVSRSPESFAASRSAFYGSMLHKAETCHVLHKRRRGY